MILLIDRGNRALKAALASGARIERRWRDESPDAERALRRILSEASPEAVAVSSVVPSWMEAARRVFAERPGLPILEITSRIEHPFEILVERPDLVGSDRLCAAAGARALGEREAIIIDAGTAITVDLLSARGFLGGAIAPGAPLMLRALHEWTAALPLLDAPEGAPVFPGRSTAEAMIAGTELGIVGIVRELARRGRASLGSGAPSGAVPPSLVTGGSGARLAEELGAAEGARFVPDLVFLGMLHLFSLNRGTAAR